ncbi:MAG: hypothetical protein NTW50_01120 [Candidatus Berkelbacteria bacterium]|nr:hypothetical protein [Candidatus Berkelbacteria bacterium]
MLETTLQKLGLSDKESKVYLAALQLGAAPVQKIAEKAKINRPTTYVILETLSKKGLATTHEQGKKTLFAAEPPERLTLLLDKMEAEVKEKQAELLDAMPDLKAIFNFAGNKPRVKFYEGLEGIRALNAEADAMLKPNAHSYAFNNLDLLFETFPDELSSDIDIRLQKKNFVHVIYTRKDGPMPDANSKEKLREARFIPLDKFPFDATIAINPGYNVNFYSYTGNVGGVMIQDIGIADAMKKIWDLCWEAAEKYN